MHITWIREFVDIFFHELSRVLVAIGLKNSIYVQTPIASELQEFQYASSE